jgi:hypothetical protein
MWTTRTQEVRRRHLSLKTCSRETSHDVVWPSLFVGQQERPRHENDVDQLSPDEEVETSHGQAEVGNGSQNK